MYWMYASKPLRVANNVGDFWLFAKLVINNMQIIINGLYFTQWTTNAASI